MNLKRIVSPAVLLALACFHTASAAPSADYLPRVAQALEGSTQLRDRALAAQLSTFGSYSTRLIANDAAPNGAPVSDEPLKAVVVDLRREVAVSDDALALSMALQYAQSIGDKAQLKAAAQRWHLLEPDNLAPLLWLGLPEDEMLSFARKARRYNSLAYDQVRFLVTVFERVPLSVEEAAAAKAEGIEGQDGQALVHAFALWAAYGIPPFQDLSKLCSGGEALHLDVARLADCRHLGRLLATESDVHVAQGIGFGLLQRTAATPAEVAEVAALRRTLDWQLQQRYGDHKDKTQMRDEVITMLRLLRGPAMKTESQLSEAMLRERGIATVPPADWQAPARK